MSEVIFSQGPRTSEKDTHNKTASHGTKRNSGDYDEIGEEFKFSDSDLEEEFVDCSSIVANHSNHSDNDQFTTATTTTTKTLATPPTSTTTERFMAQIDSGGSTSLGDVIANDANETKNQMKNNVSLSGNLSVSTPSPQDNTFDKDGNDDDDDDDDYYSDEPEEELLVQFLGAANRIAEARLKARRQTRTEAREIRLRELEKQQKHQEQNGDRFFDMHTTPTLEPLGRTRLENGTKPSSTSSRHSSEDSFEEEERRLDDPRQELKDVEERFRKAMIANAQLENERASQSYQIQHLKDELEEVTESNMQLQRELKEKTRDCNALQRNLDKLADELKLVQAQLTERDALIADHGLVVVTVENEEGADAKRTLISAANAQLLISVNGSLDVRLQQFNEEKQSLRKEVQQLRNQLEDYKLKYNETVNNSHSIQSPEESEAYKEAIKSISDHKFRLQKAEQDIDRLQENLTHSETELLRYKSAAAAAEKDEARLKEQRGKIQQEIRKTFEHSKELEVSNRELLKRLDILKNNKNALSSNF